MTPTITYRTPADANGRSHVVTVRRAAKPAPQPAGPPPCVYRGGPTGETVECAGCGGRTRLKVYGCETHGACVLGSPAGAVAGCGSCKERKEAPFRWVSTARLAADAVRLAGLLPPDVVGIVGLPRSGMIPAAVVATHLHLPLWELADGSLRKLGAGSRGNSLVSGSGRLAVVDDTVYSGAAMRKARQAAPGLLYAAVYARPQAREAVDVYAEDLPSPHLLEWNAFNGGPFTGYAMNPVYGSGIAVDFDGVLCHDADSGGRAGSPYLLPRRDPCRLIATGRHERHRAETEAWLTRHGVRWERLEMLPDDVPLTTEAAAAHKARHFKASGCGFFVESCPDQAERIFRAAGLPVVCPRADTVFQ